MTRRLLLIAIASHMSVALLAGPSSAGAANQAVDVGVDAQEPSVSLAPLRFDPKEGRRGDTLRFELRVRNTTADVVTLRTRTIPLRGSSRPDTLATPADASSRSAAAVPWVRYSLVGATRLEPGTELPFTATVRIPRDAVPGTYALALAVYQRVGRSSGGNPDAAQSDVAFAPSLGSTAIVRVAGRAEARVSVQSVDAPRVVWGGQPTFEVHVRNTGATDLELDAQVVLGAFFGSAGRTLGAEQQYAVPEGRRVLRMRWSDPPLLGWYRPELVVVGGAGSGVRVTDELPSVWVLPPWWFVLALVLAIGAPLRMGWRRRRDPARQEELRERARARVDRRLRTEDAKRRAAERRRGGGR